TRAVPCLEGFRGGSEIRFPAALFEIRRSCSLRTETRGRLGQRTIRIWGAPCRPIQRTPPSAPLHRALAWFAHEADQWIPLPRKRLGSAFHQVCRCSCGRRENRRSICDSRCKWKQSRGREQKVATQVRLWSP